MARRITKRRGSSRPALVGLLAVAVALSLVAPTNGERSQRGNLIVSLDGQLSPQKRPRHLAAPVSLWLTAGLRMKGDAQLPPVAKVELGLPAVGTLSNRGLARCPVAALRHLTRSGALERCRAALVGRGRIGAEVLLPRQEPIFVRAHALAFNGQVAGRTAVLLHAYAANPPIATVLPFVLHRRAGAFGRVLVALPLKALGPRARLSHLRLNLFRRYRHRGGRASYLGAPCPIPRRLTAGFFSLAQVRFTLADGRHVSTSIARGCRAE